MIAFGLPHAPPVRHIHTLIVLTTSQPGTSIHPQPVPISRLVLIHRGLSRRKGCWTRSSVELLLVEASRRSRTPTTNPSRKGAIHAVAVGTLVAPTTHCHKSSSAARPAGNITAHRLVRQTADRLPSLQPHHKVPGVPHALHCPAAAQPVPEPIAVPIDGPSPPASPIAGRHHLSHVRSRLRLSQCSLNLQQRRPTPKPAAEPSHAAATAPAAAWLPARPAAAAAHHVQPQPAVCHARSTGRRWILPRPTQSWDDAGCWACRNDAEYRHAADGRQWSE